MQQAELLDLSFLYDIAENDPGYICDVLEIFLSTMPDGLKKLEGLIKQSDDWEGIYKQSHFLKSSVSVVKVRDMFDKLSAIELLAKDKKDKDRIAQLFDEIAATFDEALPLIIAKRDNREGSKA
jgi:DNA mismatch repair ATPase MutS